MSFSSDYSLKSAQGVSRRSACSAGARFVEFIRSLFQNSSEKYAIAHKYSASTTAASCVSNSLMSEHRRLVSPVRSSSQYEYLSDGGKNSSEICKIMALSRTQFVLPGSPSSAPPPHPCNYTIEQFYTPQLKRSSAKPINNEAAGLQGIRIVNLNERLMRAHSHYRPEEIYVIRAEPRPIYSESVEVDVCSATPEQLLSLPTRFDKRIVSVANIAVDGMHADAVDIRPQISNITEKKILLKRQNYDKRGQQVQVTEEDELNRQMKIKEKIVAEWEHRWHLDEQRLESSFSSLATREEPMIVSCLAVSFCCTNSFTI
ncbi:unnamed protein product [Hydatigera taeniaeformis]|uniref:PH domain-containing protein n=1 Tax=Hydatigena taeniaeformis TaxID=6205 RepID=A0A0R3X8K6_HYDTA|nr:unnamed protein product [Hydatigera taeniaeformis]